jgi:hypothetical protein
MDHTPLATVALRNDIRMFAIQRVLSSRENGETFDRPADFRGAEINI